jgi:hypothetical protein
MQNVKHKNYLFKMNIVLVIGMNGLDFTLIHILTILTRIVKITTF